MVSTSKMGRLLGCAVVGASVGACAGGASAGGGSAGGGSAGLVAARREEPVQGPRHFGRKGGVKVAGRGVTKSNMSYLLLLY